MTNMFDMYLLLNVKFEVTKGTVCPCSITIVISPFYTNNIIHANIELNIWQWIWNTLFFLYLHDRFYYLEWQAASWWVSLSSSSSSTTFILEVIFTGSSIRFCINHVGVFSANYAYAYTMFFKQNLKEALHVTTIRSIKIQETRFKM